MNQVGDKIPDIVSSLEIHPHIRRVTPHKKVTRTLKLVKRENFTLCVDGIFIIYLYSVAGFMDSLLIQIAVFLNLALQYDFVFFCPYIFFSFLL